MQSSNLGLRGCMRTIWSAAALLLAALAWPGLASAAGGLVDVRVVDRETGGTLDIYQFRGSRYVAGRPGAHYAIRITNRTENRVLAVMAVDGVNIVTGQTASFDQVGYVLGPRERYEITGWRKSDKEVAAFVFTSLPESYAARTGRPLDVGVIGVAVFNERSVTRPSAPPVARPQAAPGTAARADGAGNASAAAEASAEGRAAQAAQEKLGTGHGERETSHSTTTHFVRSTAEPADVVAIQYDTYASLERAGVIRPSNPSTPSPPRPFPQSPPGPGFVPDPPRR